MTKLDYMGLHWTILDHTGLYWTIFDYTRLYLNIVCNTGQTFNRFNKSVTLRKTDSVTDMTIPREASTSKNPTRINKLFNGFQLLDPEVTIGEWRWGHLTNYSSRAFTL